MFLHLYNENYEKVLIFLKLFEKEKNTILNL